MSDSDSDKSTNTKSVSIIKLIELVRERACLWDRSDAYYKRRLAKEEAWNEIYKAIKSDYEKLSDKQKTKFGNSITRKWYNVRDAYVKSRRAESRYRPYVYSDRLKFLDPIYFGEKAVAKVYKSVRGGSASNDEDDNETHMLHEVYTDNIDVEISAKRSKMNDERISNETEDSIVAVLANLIQREEDEDRAFFKSITPTVKKLSENAKFQFRLKVMNLLEELKKEDNRCVKSEAMSNYSDSD